MRLKAITAIVLLSLTLLSCASHNAYLKAKTAEVEKDWDVAVVQYEKALDIDPDNRSYIIALDRAKREASRAHFEKGKTLVAAAKEAKNLDQLRLAQLAMAELEITVRLDPTNQYAAVELTKIVGLINDIQKAASEQTTLEDVKKRARSSISKAQPPQLNPASTDPISLTFSRDTPVKDIYRALGNAFGINILFDQAVKDDRITIELRDVTAQQALERVMQAANHFYKTLDEKTIIVIPDNPQARRDYEDLVIQTFYLSNGDAEQVTNVVRTMIEARNVFPLKALNAITIRDTADKVRIAEKIIEANDKAKAEVVVQVELVEMNLSNVRELGFAITGIKNGGVTPLTLDANGNPVIADNKTVPFTGGTLADLARSLGDVNALRKGISVAIPAATYSMLKSIGNTEVLANPELRISEGEKATLHIGDRIPVPVTTFTSFVGGTGNNTNNGTPFTSFQYQDVGIKVAIEPRVHHNREVTLKLTVEVSSQGNPVKFAGQEQPTFSTRTIESTIRLMDGETNFLAGLIQSSKVTSAVKTPILGDLPFIGRLFTNEGKDERRTDLVLTMTPHIVRIPDITEEDVAPMWVGTGNNLTFRGVSPRIESQGSNGDPFVPARSEEQFNPNANLPLSDGEPGNYILPEGDTTTTDTNPATPPPTSGTPPSDPFRRNQPAPAPTPQPPDENGNPPQASSQSSSLSTSKKLATTSAATTAAEVDTAALRLAPRIAPQPASIILKPGETRLWEVVGMDLDGLTTPELAFRFDPRAMDVTDVTLGAAVQVDPAKPPVVSIDRNAGTIKVKSTDGKPLTFISGGEVLLIRVHGGVTGETYLVIDNPTLQTKNGEAVVAAIAGGRARVQ